MVTVVWETWLKDGFEKEGLDLTRRIWKDMRTFDAYISHEMLIDFHDPGHILVHSKWTTKEEADRIRDVYSNAEPVRLIQSMLSKPRNRSVFLEDTINQS